MLFSKKKFTGATHALAVDASSESTCINKINGVQHSAPSVFPAKKALEVNRSYAQKEAQNYHISYIRMAVSNGTLLAFRRQAGWRRKKKMKNSKVSTVSGWPP